MSPVTYRERSKYTEVWWRGTLHGRITYSFTLVGWVFRGRNHETPPRSTWPECKPDVEAFFKKVETMQAALVAPRKPKVSSAGDLYKEIASLKALIRKNWNHDCWRGVTHADANEVRAVLGMEPLE